MTAKTYFRLGTFPMILFGGVHFLLALGDAVRPTFFVPVDESARVAMEATHIALTSRMSVWPAWRGFHISHGLGVGLLGLLLFLVASSRFKFVHDSTAFVLIALFASGVLLATSLAFWFYAPSIGMAVSFVCFAVAGAKLKGERSHPTT